MPRFSITIEPVYRPGCPLKYNVGEGDSRTAIVVTLSALVVVPSSLATTTTPAAAAAAGWVATNERAPPSDEGRVHENEKAPSGVVVTLIWPQLVPSVRTSISTTCTLPTSDTIPSVLANEDSE